jgi:hypothetical protein
LQCKGGVRELEPVSESLRPLSGADESVERDPSAAIETRTEITVGSSQGTVEGVVVLRGQRLHVSQQRQGRLLSSIGLKRESREGAPAEGGVASIGVAVLVDQWLVRRQVAVSRLARIGSEGRDNAIVSFDESLWKLRCEVVHESEGAEQRLERCEGSRAGHREQMFRPLVESVQELIEHARGVDETTGGEVRERTGSTVERGRAGDQMKGEGVVDLREGGEGETGIGESVDGAESGVPRALD